MVDPDGNPLRRKELLYPVTGARGKVCQGGIVSFLFFQDLQGGDARCHGYRISGLFIY